jgi:hypothetical protein
MLASFFNIGIHMSVVKNEKGIKRQISQIVEYYIQDNKVRFNVIYENNGDTAVFNDLSLDFATRLKINKKWY